MIGRVVHHHALAIGRERGGQIRARVVADDDHAN